MKVGSRVSSLHKPEVLGTVVSMDGEVGYVGVFWDEDSHAQLARKDYLKVVPPEPTYFTNPDKGDDIVVYTKTLAEAEQDEVAERADHHSRYVAASNPKDIIGVLKPDLSLVPPAGVIHVATAMENGAAKYGAYNWREHPVQVMTYLAAAQRHILAYLDGEDVAEDSGVTHLGHAGACIFIVLDALETGNVIDNRPKPGAASRLIKRLTKGGK